MAAKQGIRIIKHNQRSQVNGTVELAPPSKAEVKDLTREVASTVSSWVREYKQRRAQRGDAALRFEMLFREPAVTQATS